MQVRPGEVWQYSSNDGSGRPTVLPPLTIVEPGKRVGDWVGRDPDGQLFTLWREQLEGGRFHRALRSSSVAQKGSGQ